MSQSHEALGEGQAPAIDLAGKRKWGYVVAQVDEFLTRAHELYDQPQPGLSQSEIQLQSFDLERNGYVIGQVDATLSRLERAVVDKQTEWDISHQGQAVWLKTVMALAESLRERAQRDHGDKFAPGLKRVPSYDMKQVDSLVDRAWAHISQALKLSGAGQVAGASRPETTSGDNDELTSLSVSNIIFTQRKGRHGYDESSVDAYLNRIIQVLTYLESFARVSGADSLPLTRLEPGSQPSVSTSSMAPTLPSSAGPTGATEAFSAFPGGLFDSSDHQTLAAGGTADRADGLAAQLGQSRAEAGLETQDTLAVSTAAGTTRPAESVVSSSLASLVRPKADQAESDDLNHQDSSAGRSNIPTGPAFDGAQAQPVSFPVSQQAVTDTPAFPPANWPSASAPAVAPSFAPSPASETTSGTAAAPPAADSEDFLASILDHGSIQTSSFEIPNLTFPAVSTTSTEGSGAPTTGEGVAHSAAEDAQPAQ